MGCSLKALRRLAALTVLLPALAACARVPRLDIMGPNYKPITAEVATIAAPHPPGEDIEQTPPPRPLHCRVGKGTARFARDWADFASADFTLTLAGRTEVTLAPAHNAARGALSFQGWFDENGQKIVFCPVKEGPPDKKI